VHEHLRRLTRVWIEPPIYFITICTRNRRSILTRENAANVLIAEWQNARANVIVGQLVATLSWLTTSISFAGRNTKQKPCHGSSGLGRHGPAEKIQRARPQPTAAATTPQALWQREFFDHLLRSSESYSEKWNYVRDNPVRSGFVLSADDWPYSGEIERLEF
jgi:REP element-mobilizing transposase RayT